MSSMPPKKPSKKTEKFDLALLSPQRLIRLIEQNQVTVVLNEDNKLASKEFTKQLKGDANALLATKLFGTLMVTMRADAVDTGIVKYSVPEHAMYAKAVWHVTTLLERTIKELSELKIE
jgi:hypothetical protein